MKKFELLTIWSNPLGGVVDVCGISTDEWEGSLFYLEWGGGIKFDLLWMGEAIRNTIQLFKFGR